MAAREIKAGQRTRAGTPAFTMGTGLGSMGVGPVARRGVQRPFSIALGQACGGLCLLAALLAVARRRVRRVVPAVFWPALAFAAIAVLSVAFGPEPFRLVKKTGRLVWFLFIPVAATLVQTAPRRESLLKAFILGSGVLGLKVVLVNSWKAWRASTRSTRRASPTFPAGSWRWGP